MASVCELFFKENLYIGGSIYSSFESVEFVVDLLKQGKSVFNIYIICKNEGSSNFLEIIESTEIFKSVYAYKKYKVVGIAQGKREAIGMIAKIFFDCAETMDI